MQNTMGDRWVYSRRKLYTALLKIHSPKKQLSATAPRNSTKCQLLSACVSCLDKTEINRILAG